MHVAKFLLLHTLLHVFYDEYNPTAIISTYGLVDSCLFDLQPYTPFFILGADIVLFIL